MNLNDQRNLTMLTDFYEITMANGFFANGFDRDIAYFDIFFRQIPDGGGFCIMAGVEQMIDYIKNLSFTREDIDFLRGKKMFDERFLRYLADFKFSSDVWAVPEGTPIFPGEPIVTVRGPAIEAQFMETMLLICINHQTLIATKANRICRAASGRAVMEFGARRAQGFDAAIYGSRAAYIGGCAGTSCTLSDRDFSIPAMGTMAHSWVQMFDSETDAFRAYAKLYPNACMLLVDTYNVLKSGIPNAIRIFNEEIIPRGYRPAGIRIDSGDITYLSKKARKMLDEAGFADCKICASNSLDEFIIRDMLIQGAPLDIFGVGERLITASSNPVLGAVYKLTAIERNGMIIPKIKVSENISKITTPGFKKLWRLYDNETGKAIADVITLSDEMIDDAQEYEIFDPISTWKRKTVENFTARPLLERIFKNGRCVYETPDLQTLQSYCKNQVATLWDEVTRFENPHRYYVDLSPNLWHLKQELLSQYTIRTK
ncbi:MAG: nicotinate phosphoribosyltransferase [Clostridia bacterium]|nr:nicotinate phosphoribosyltransferase [Clostridia bacterium]